MEILAALLIFLGLVGSVLPLLPGPPLSFVGLLIYAFATDFTKVKAVPLIIFGVLSALTVVLDFIAPALGAKSYKSSGYGVPGALIGSFLGIFFLGPLGVIFGPLVGGFAGEMLFKFNVSQAAKSALGVFVGFVLGTVFRLAVAFGISGYFLWALFK